MERMPSVSFVSRRMLIAAAISVSLLVALVFNVDVAAAQSASKHQLPRLHKQRLIVLTVI